MEVQFTDDQKAFILDGIQTGRFAREEDALQEALSLWEVRERRRAEILAAVEQAEASFARGEGRRITTREEAARLADEIKQRGLARLNSEQAASGTAQYAHFIAPSHGIRSEIAPESLLVRNAGRW
jgi:Arc/MetJ-type ribon-helix-helix transcriptional regulator